MNISQRLAKLEEKRDRTQAQAERGRAWDAEKMRGVALEAWDILKSLGYAEGPPR